MLLLTPEEQLLKLNQFLIFAVRKRDLLHRGHQLYEWIESYTGATRGLNLGPSSQGHGLPDQHCYREFGLFIHELWEDVRQNGGELKRPVRAIKVMLRADLQRTRRERQVLNSAYAQLGLMTVMVWFYLFFFSRVTEIKFSLMYWVACLAWQALGGVLFCTLLKRKRGQLFKPLDDLLRALQVLNLIAFRGRLSGNFLPLPQKMHRLKKDYLRYYHTLESTLDSWRERGRANFDVLDELREDLSLLAEDAQLIFLPWIRALSFLWAIVFVLPLLFASSLFGLYKLAVV